MHCEKVWRDWVITRSSIPVCQQETALLRVSNYLQNAPSDELVPLMTRCRPLPDIFRLVRAYRLSGVHCDDVQAFFAQAHRDTREAFNEIRLKSP